MARLGPDHTKGLRGLIETEVPFADRLICSRYDQRSLLSDYDTQKSHQPAMPRGSVTSILFRNPYRLSLEQDLYSKVTPP